MSNFQTLICTAALVLSSMAANAQAQDQWVATWAASPQSARFSFPLPARATTPAPAGSQTSPPPPLFPAPPTFKN
jgi:hypothetical protein